MGARIWRAALETVFIALAWYLVFVEKRGWDPESTIVVAVIAFILAFFLPYYSPRPVAAAPAA